MATKKVSKTNVPRENIGKINDYITQPSLSRHGAKEKENGKVYEANFQWDMPGFRNPMEGGSKFVQCNDGFYQVYDSRGERTSFRVGEDIMKKVFGAEWVV